MDSLSSAASVIAIIDISAKITLLYFKYSVAVKDAKKDIECSKRTIAHITGLVKKIKQLSDGRDKARLSTTCGLSGSLKGYFQGLKEVKEQLEPGECHKAMSRLGPGTLKMVIYEQAGRKYRFWTRKIRADLCPPLQVD
ncbi:uncharacterized protein BDR25DRAFT_364246 [Lindgomyces ingoldianus]|uniref:Uncharacterized protein n=1 Tax=Lindgomyces ingoldianus TaxID=673940 RepID=A0ACB6RDM1_9PLEO|nr:uncharacterized protein BDR25DRAFT_364246 [Lindgomyces ingoldianus]KAF2477438.1 hypothetical protein BDR25DRAFT_364246 [Lindgomyces ingoldianus]